MITARYTCIPHGNRAPCRDCDAASERREKAVDAWLEKQGGLLPVVLRNYSPQCPRSPGLQAGEDVKDRIKARSFNRAGCRLLACLADWKAGKRSFVDIPYAGSKGPPGIYPL